MLQYKSYNIRVSRFGIWETSKYIALWPHQESGNAPLSRPDLGLDWHLAKSLVEGQLGTSYLFDLKPIGKHNKNVLKFYHWMLLICWITGWVSAKLPFLRYAVQNAWAVVASHPMTIFHNFGDCFFQSSCTTSLASIIGITIGFTVAVSGSYISISMGYVGNSDPKKVGSILCRSRSQLLLCFPQPAKEARSLMVSLSKPSRSAACEYRWRALTWSSWE